MDFDLSPEHELLRRTIRDFVAREVEPHIDEHEKLRKFPADIVAMLGPIGMLGVPISEENGGAGLDTLAHAITVEELSPAWARWASSSPPTSRSAAAARPGGHARAAPALPCRPNVGRRKIKREEA